VAQEGKDELEDELNEMLAMDEMDAMNDVMIPGNTIADANPSLQRHWILIESIEVVLARRLNGNLRDTDLENNLRKSPADLKVEYKVFVPLSHSGSGFEAESLNGNGFVAAINTKAEAAGMSVKVKSATSSVVSVEEVGSDKELSGSMRVMGSAFLVFSAWLCALA